MAPSPPKAVGNTPVISNSPHSGQAKGDGQSPETSIIPQIGERAISIGQTGSGKTLFNIWLLDRIENSPMVVYDTKHDDKFKLLPRHRIVTSLRAAHEAVDDETVDFVVFRTPPHITSDPGALDDLLVWHEEAWHRVGAYIDELYHFHRGGRAGAGLTGLFTRGRARGITTLGSTQRPAWVSGHVFSEAQRFYIGRLSRLSDRKRVADFIEGYDRAGNPPKYHFHYREDGDDGLRLLSPVPLDPRVDPGYTDDPSKLSSDGEHPPESEQRPTDRIPTVWI